MIGSSYGYRIKIIARLVKHLTEIAEAFRLRILVHHFLGVSGSHIHIAQSHNFYHTGTGKIVYNLLATVSNAYIGNLHFIRHFPLRSGSTGSQHITGPECQSGRSHCHRFQKISSCRHISLVLIKLLSLDHLQAAFLFFKNKLLIP